MSLHAMNAFCRAVSRQSKGYTCDIHLPCCRLQAEVQLVTPKLGNYADVRLRAALYEVNEDQPSGFAEAVPAVEIEITDQDHWISVDNTIRATHAEAGVGGLAIVGTSFPPSPLDKQLARSV